MFRVTGGDVSGPRFGLEAGYIELLSVVDRDDDQATASATISLFDKYKRERDSPHGILATMGAVPLFLERYISEACCWDGLPPSESRMLYLAGHLLLPRPFVVQDGFWH